MPTTIQEIYQVASTLPAKERLQLATLLLNGLVQQDITAIEDSEPFSEVLNTVASSAEPQAQTPQGFRRHAGAISLGYATGTSNDSIDADLTRAYANEG